MTRRRPGTGDLSQAEPRRPAAGQNPTVEGAPIFVWYAALIGLVLLLAAAAYIYVLHRQMNSFRAATEQLTIGQDLLRTDRDEVLKVAREREAALSVLEVSSGQDRQRLERLEDQRKSLQSEVLRLTQELAESRERANGVEPPAADVTADVERLERERDRLTREMSERQATIAELSATLADKEEDLVDRAEALDANEDRIERLQAEADAWTATKADLESRVAALDEELAAFREGDRQRQILRGHRASLGEVQPYIADVDPGDWLVIEDWLAGQLQRPMALPDLAEQGWSYEGARLLGAADGPPMVMLLYADAEDRPVSLTITRDSRGEQDISASEIGGIQFLDWREERHAFTLAGEAAEDELRPVALALKGEPPMQADDAAVPTSRYVRPSFRPTSP